VLAQTTDSVKHVDTALHRPHTLIDTPLIDTSLNAIANDTSARKAITRDTTQHKIVQTASTGYVINGKVADMNTGEGIPFASVFFSHSSLGTSADLDGNFVLRLDKFPGDTIRMGALGYKPAKKVLRKSLHDYNFIVELERSNVALGEFVMHAGEDPVVVLMRHIIERKPVNNADRTVNYRYEAFNRLELDLQRLTQDQFKKIPILKSYAFIFDNLDTVTESKPYLPLYMTETLSDFYFQHQPKKQMEFIRASMIKGVNNENVVKYLGTLHQNVNVYKNYIPIFDKKYVSPISNEGLFYYKYKIKDTQVAYGHNIILVQFTPRRPEENCFTGDFWVVDSVFALQRISMDVSGLSNINWVDRISLYQEFAPVDSFWFLSKDKFIADFKIYSNTKIPGFIGRKTTTYHHIKINSDSTAGVLSDPQWKEEVTKLDSVKDKTEQWWQTNRPDSLTANEKKISKMVDTINKMPITTVYKNFINFSISGVKDVGPIELGPYYYLYSTNVVEGNRFRVSIGTPRTLKQLHFTLYGAYGTKDGMFKYGSSGLWMISRHPWTTLYAYQAHDVSQSTNYYDQLGSDNIFSALFRKPGIPWKLAFADDQRIEFFKQYFMGFSHKFILEHKDYTPYAPLPYVGIFHDQNGNPSTSVNSSEFGIELRYAYKESYLEGLYQRLNIGSKYPVLNFSFTVGSKGILNSGYQYQKARFTVTESINIPPFGSLYYNVFVGKYFSSTPLPYPLLEIHPGNEYEYYNQYAFEMMNNYEFLSDKYAGFNIEHNLGGGIFGRIPVVKKWKLRQFWTAKGILGSLNKADLALNNSSTYQFRSLKGDPYLELGTGVANIFKLFRIDFVWRVTPKPEATEKKYRYFGVFGSVKVQL
jgi:hypothetical protein